MEGSFFPRGFGKKLCPSAAPGLKNAPARGGWSPFPRLPRPGFLTPLPHASGWLGLPGLHALGPQLSLPGLWDTVARGTGAGVWRVQLARGVGDGGAPRREEQGAEALVGLSRSRGTRGAGGDGQFPAQAAGRSLEGRAAEQSRGSQRRSSPAGGRFRRHRHHRVATAAAESRCSSALPRPAPPAAWEPERRAPGGGEGRAGASRGEGAEPGEGAGGGRSGRGRGGGERSAGRARAKSASQREGAERGREPDARGDPRPPGLPLGKVRGARVSGRRCFESFLRLGAKEATRVSSSELPLDGSLALTPVGGFLSSSRFILSPTLAASFQPCTLQSPRSPPQGPSWEAQGNWTRGDPRAPGPARAGLTWDGCRRIRQIHTRTCALDSGGHGGR